MQKKNGFTLVELAIALMVIGLLIGGVLKGQELIENAKITATIRQIKAYDTAAMIFSNSYGALPGDIKHPTRIPNCTDDVCVNPGDGNGKIDSMHAGLPQESLNFFTHLTKAGMIQGPEGGTSTEAGKAQELDLTGGTPFTPSAGLSSIPEEHRLFFPELPIEPAFIADFLLVNAVGGGDKNAYLIGNMPVRTAAAIDTKIDNGKPDVHGLGYMHTKSCPYITAADINDWEYDTQSNNFCHIVLIQADF